MFQSEATRKHERNRRRVGVEADAVAGGAAGGVGGSGGGSHDPILVIPHGGIW
jgi:hypothetical protein